MAKEYIEREAYYRQIDNLSKGKHGVYCAAINDCMNALDEQTAADVVEVVRCKDCVFYVSEVCRHDLALNLCRGDDFCSYGERSNNNAE